MIVKTTRITLVQDPWESVKSKHAATGKACPESTPASVRFPRKQQRYPKWLLETKVSGCDGPKTFLKLATSRDFRTQQQSHLRSAINRETFRVLVASSTNSLDPPPTHFWWTRHSRPLSVCLEQSWFSLHLETMKIWKKSVQKPHKIRKRIKVRLSGDFVMLIFGCFQSQSSRSFRLCRNSASAFLPCSCRT